MAGIHRTDTPAVLPPVASEPGPAAVRLESFDYSGVRLGESRWLAQYRAAREFYSGISDDDILHGFRRSAGLPAPGRPLGGWCRQTSATVFGQWLSGMSRMCKATGDERMRDKAIRLMTEWAKTVKPDGDSGMRHYPYDKLVCGLVDLQLYGGHQQAIAALEKVTAFAVAHLNRDNMPADPAQNQGYYGRPQEWYTLSENLYRAYRLTAIPCTRPAATGRTSGSWRRTAVSARRSTAAPIRSRRRADRGRGSSSRAI